VKKPAPPAALARLIAPGTLVSQGSGADVFEGLAEWDGPVIAAVLPEGAAVFRYQPRDGEGGRLKVESSPDTVTRPVGYLSTARQQSDLALLRLLEGAAAGRVVEAAAGPSEAAAAPADKLAAWLIRQATIPEPGEG
jgi:hypothetical protein